MERRLTEERVTKRIISWLKGNGWEIVCFDYPQSGTGFVLQPDLQEESGSKNKGSMIPDIVAIKDMIVVLFENKDRFYIKDFDKLERVRELNTYSKSLGNLLRHLPYKKIYYGVGFPKCTEKQLITNKNKVDFIVGCDGVNIEILYQKESLF